MNEGIRNELTAYIGSPDQTADVIETLTAMLNRHGEAYILVDTADTVISPELIRGLFDAILTRITPMVIPVLSLKEYGGIHMILIRAEGKDRPYCADGRYMLRSGSTNMRIDPSELEVYFPMQKKTVSTPEKAPLSLSQTKVFNAIKDDPQILTRDIAEVADLKISRVNQVIRELKDAGRISRVGSNKSGYWQVNE